VLIRDFKEKGSGEIVCELGRFLERPPPPTEDHNRRARFSQAKGDCAAQMRAASAHSYSSAVEEARVEDGGPLITLPPILSD
jgi:hypothetical protein